MPYINSDVHLLRNLPQISGWQWWAQQLGALLKSPRVAAVAALEGVTLQHAMAMAGGRSARAGAAESATHSRFAYAMALNELICEGSAAEAAVRWGLRETASPHGARLPLTLWYTC